MTLIVDAGPLVSSADRDDAMLGRVQAILRAERGSIVLPAPVTAEVDYMLKARGGSHANLAFLDDLAAGRFRVECLEPHEYATVARLERQYGGQLGLADLSVVVLAARFDTLRILTFDERHFRAVAPLQGGKFTLLPADG
jgi:hypothetical protein